MSRELITCSPTASFEDTLKMILERGVSSLPVVDGGTLVGIVTSKYLLNNIEIKD